MHVRDMLPARALLGMRRITLPTGAVSAASELGKPGDWLYCSELLEATGVVVVPGSGFGQADGTLHFRTTFLPPEDDIQVVVDKLTSFHASFIAKYGGLD
jgi:aspartate/methionine/tyrosine aminotransferase